MLQTIHKNSQSYLPHNPKLLKSFYLVSGRMEKISSKSFPVSRHSSIQSSHQDLHIQSKHHFKCLAQRLHQHSNYYYQSLAKHMQDINNADSHVSKNWLPSPHIIAKDSVTVLEAECSRWIQIASRHCQTNSTDIFQTEQLLEQDELPAPDKHKISNSICSFCQCIQTFICHLLQQSKFCVAQL